MTRPSFSAVKNALKLLKCENLYQIAIKMISEMLSTDKRVLKRLFLYTSFINNFLLSSKL